MSAAYPAATDYVNMPHSSDISDSQFGVHTSSPDQDWWRSAESVALHSIAISKQDVLTRGKRCLISGCLDPGEMAHLMAKCTKVHEIRKLQYAFGRKLDINSRWFCIYLKSDLHRLFGKGRYKWALIPTPDVITRIADKLVTEQERRLNLNIQGAWPDYRQPDWFPITKAGIDCHFVPLGMADVPFNSFLRLRSLDDPSAPYGVFRHFNPPDFEGFPILRVRSHPYSLILNAFPKLGARLRSNNALPPIVADSYNKLDYIYYILTGAPELEDDSEAGNGSNDTDVCSRLRPRTPSWNTNQSTESDEDSAEQDYDDLFEAAYDDNKNMIMDPLLPDSTSERPDILLKEAGSALPYPPPLFVELKHQDVSKWAAGVERARGLDGLVELEDDLSPMTKQYAAEPVRAPPIVTWYERESKLGFWYAVLPDVKRRGVLSSNDWVSMKNLPPLTRKLDSD
ncbi:hypothetical protein RSOLAG22IIIB_02923 [Rhizoctonia solani]|uniref:Uncharacterized protein n=1 Tax=Rhizoctonia solani TaxID=456999 RepID=A0A0K6FM02_9AGAM|nr:hypothetical protein RSOLAG22IIIB_02923 [Rhizoctonia solani]